MDTRKELVALETRCPAKVNLTLEVLGRSPDGYHRIASIMQAISLSDTLALELSQEILFECDQPALAGPDNLVFRAARMLKEATGYPGGARIHLTKGIPEAAGLGGGSSDAAGALKGLIRLWRLDLRRERLLEMAAMLGSDVPFFIGGGTALAEGRGDRITPLPSPSVVWLVLLRPPLSLPEKTRKLYGSLASRHYTGGEHTRAMAEALRAGQPLPVEDLFNVFEQVAPAVFPGLDRYRDRLLDAGAKKIHLAGSGPTLFAIFRDRESAERSVARLRGLEVYLAHTSVKPDNITI